MSSMTIPRTISDPDAAYYVHEEAMGWRLPRDPENELTLQGFIATIESPDPVNRTGMVHYKDSNSEILGWIAERVSGRRLRDFIADIVDAAGIEGRFAMCTDRTGFSRYRRWRLPDPARPHPVWIDLCPGGHGDQWQARRQRRLHGKDGQGRHRLVQGRTMSIAIPTSPRPMANGSAMAAIAGNI